jgi:CcmD family protein
MTSVKRLLAVVLLTTLWAGVPTLIAQSQPPKQQSEYIPIDQLPPQDQLPAAPLLIAAYSFVLAVFFLYVLSLARRLNSVQREVDRLDTAMKQGKA